MALAAALQAAEPSSEAAIAVMQRDVVVPDTEEQVALKVETGQVLQAIRKTDDGYEVVCRDSRGQAFPALLPYRDEWGHLTCDAWTYDPSLADHTVRVKITGPLVPMHFQIHRAEEYQHVKRDGDNCIILYQTHGQSISLLVPTNAVELRPMPPVIRSATEARKSQLELALVQSKDEQAQLRDQNRRASEDAARLVELMRQLSDAEAGCNLLKAQPAANEEVRDQMTRYVPETAKAQEEGSQAIAKLVRQQAPLTASLTTAEMEKATLDGRRKELLKCDAEIEALKAKVLRTRSEMNAMADYFSDPVVAAEQEKLRVALQEESKKETVAAVSVGKTERERDTRKVFQDEIERIRQEIAKLQTSLAALCKEIEQLNRQLAGTTTSERPAK